MGETSENKGAIRLSIWSETTVSSSSLGVSSLSPPSFSPSLSLSARLLPSTFRSIPETRITIYSKRDERRLTRCFYSLLTLSQSKFPLANFSRRSHQFLSDFLKRCNRIAVASRLSDTCCCRINRQREDT